MKKLHKLGLLLAFSMPAMASKTEMRAPTGLAVPTTCIKNLQFTKPCKTAPKNSSTLVCDKVLVTIECVAPAAITPKNGIITVPAPEITSEPKKEKE